MSGKLVFGRYDYASFCCFATYAACSTVVPVVLVQLAQALNFPLNEGGMGAGGALHLGRSIPMVAAMVFCGFAAGHWGKIRVLGAAMISMGIGILLAAQAPGYLILFAALVIAGLGEGVVEGLATPVIQDIHPKEPGRYINFTHAFWSIGVVITTVVAGLLLSFSVSWRLILSICAIAALLTSLLYLWPYHGPQKPDKPERQHWSTVLGHAGSAMKKWQFWLFFFAMFLAGGGEFCLTFWVASFIQLDYAGSAFMGGLGTACFSAGMIAGRMGSGFLLKQQHLKHLILLAAFIGTLLGVIPPLLNSLVWLFIVLFFLGIATGPFWPSIQSYCVDKMSNDDSTMLYILLSCAGVPGCGVFAWLIGFAGDHIGLRLSFFLVPICYLLLGVFIVWEDLAYKHKTEA